MARLRHLWRWTRSLATAAGLWLLVPGLAWGQGAQKGSEASGWSGGGLWVLPYFLVIFCIALGVFLVVHSSRRRERAKPEAYGKPT